MKNNLFCSKSESIQTNDKMRLTAQYLGKLEIARKFRLLQMVEACKLLNNIATTKKYKERKNLILTNEIAINDSIIQNL